VLGTVKKPTLTLFTCMSNEPELACEPPDLIEEWHNRETIWITLRTEHLDRLESLINQGVVGDRY
jgi:hypothetical protein